MTKEEKQEWIDLHGDELCEVCGSKYPCGCEEPEAEEPEDKNTVLKNVFNAFNEIFSGIQKGIDDICNEQCEHLDTEQFSVCCGGRMPDYPDNDICPDCKEHTGVEVVCKECDKVIEER